LNSKGELVYGAPHPMPRYDDVFFEGVKWLDELGAKE
jgi:hypothetical protein